jgi:hypothetical protein
MDSRFEARLTGLGLAAVFFLCLICAAANMPS